VRPVLLIVGLAVLGGPLGCLEKQDDLGLGVTVEQQNGAFFADGKDHRMVTIAVPDDTGFGKVLTVTTTLGVVNVAASDDGAKKTRTLLTQGQAPVSFDLFAGTAAGDGEVTVAAEGGLKGFATFQLLALDGTIELGAPASVTTADENVTLTLQLGGASRPTSREVTVVATKGVLTPGASGAEASQAAVTVSPEGETTLNWQPGSEPGVALITAALTGGNEDAASVVVEPTEETVALAVDPAQHLANDEALVSVEVSYGGPATLERDIVLSTSLGILDAAKDGAAAKATTVRLGGGETTQVTLLGGQKAGTVLLTAAIGGSVLSSATFPLEYAAPSILGLSLDGGSVLTQAVKKADVSVSMARPPGDGVPSIGTQVRFATCCDDGGGLGACDVYLQIPPLATDPEGSSVVQAALELTATGAAFVGQVGTPPTDNLAATLHAYVFAAGVSGPALTCGELAALPDPAATVAAITSTGVALQKLAP
jgi:hypothetical protein